MNFKQTYNTVSVVTLVSVFCVIVGAAISEWHSLYIGQRKRYADSELKLSCCKNSTVVENAFSDECREAIEHLDQYPFLNAFREMKNNAIVVVKQEMAGVFNNWIFLLFMFGCIVAMLFYLSLAFQRQRERRYYQSLENSDGYRTSAKQKTLESYSRADSADAKIVYLPIQGSDDRRRTDNLIFKKRLQPFDARKVYGIEDDDNDNHNQNNYHQQQQNSENLMKMDDFADNEAVLSSSLQDMD